MTIRKITESPLHQGEDEQIAYTLTVTPWGSSPTSVSVVIKDSSGTNKSSTCLSGLSSTNGNVITTPIVKSLTAGETYRLEIKFSIGSNIFEAYADIHAEV